MNLSIGADYGEAQGTKPLYTHKQTLPFWELLGKSKYRVPPKIFTGFYTLQK